MIQRRAGRWCTLITRETCFLLEMIPGRKCFTPVSMNLVFTLAYEE